MAGGVEPWRPPRYTNAHYAEEQRVCYELKLQGLTLREIEGVTGLPKSTVARRLECEIRETVDPLRDEYKRIVHDRYERLWKTTSEVVADPPPMVSEGRIVRWIVGRDENGKPIYGDPIPDTGAKLQAVARGESILARLSKLHGLDAPVKVDATVTETTQQDVELAAMIREAQAKSAATEQQIKEQPRGVSGPVSTG